MITFFFILVLITCIGIFSFESGWTNVTWVKRNAVVFDGRNKSYGAYDLRNRYHDNLLVAFGILMVVLMAFVSGNVIWKNIFPTIAHLKAKPDTHWEMTEYDPIDIYEQPIKAQPKLETVKPVSPTTDQPTSQIDVVDHAPVTNVPIESAAVGGSSVDGGSSTGSPTGQAGATATAVESEIYVVAEEQPSFVDGYDAMMKYLSNNMVYPDYEKDNGIQGTVYLSFVVNSSGNVIDVKELVGVRGGPNLTKEALRVVRKMPKWNPGKVQGRFVNVRFTLPIKFVIH